MRPRSHLLWIVPLVVLLLLALPTMVAERFTSPNQDGQYATHPIKAYGLIVTLLRVSGSAQLGNSGKALLRAKDVFAVGSLRPTRVKLLYFPRRSRYIYYTRDGIALTVPETPRLVWEVWGMPDTGQSLASADDHSSIAVSAGTTTSGLPLPTTVQSALDPSSATTAAASPRGTSVGPPASGATDVAAEVIGFLDYVTGEKIGTQAETLPTIT